MSTKKSKARWLELLNKAPSEINTRDIIDMQILLLDSFNLRESLRKNSTRQKAKMLDGYIRRYYIPKKYWRNVAHIIDHNEDFADKYWKEIKDLPQGC